MLNWLGRIIQKEVTKNDTVLDVGCGIMQATTESLKPSSVSIKRKIANIVHYKMQFSSKGNLKCRSLLGCDVWKPYLDISKRYFSVVNLSCDELDKFIDKSFDIVICVDVLEHMENTKAMLVIHHLIRIARKKVIVYTPVALDQPDSQIENSWNMGYNPYQKHISLIESNTLQNLGFRISYPLPDKNICAILELQKKEYR